MQVNVYNMAGEVVGQVALSDKVFGVPMNVPLVHQIVVAQQANQRVGTADTKRRGEVEGGGRKPFKQKGTGRARQGSTRAPHWKGGGVVFGPHPRSYAQAVPRKMRRQALRCALSARVSEGRLVLIDALSFERPRTKEAAALLERLNVDRTALILLPEVDENIVRSARNLPGTLTRPAPQVSVLDVMRHDYLVAPVAAIRQIEELLGGEAAEEAEELAEEVAVTPIGAGEAPAEETAPAATTDEQR